MATLKYLTIMNPVKNHLLSFLSVFLCLMFISLPFFAEAHKMTQSSKGNGWVIEKVFEKEGVTLFKYVREGIAVPFEESYAPDTQTRIEWRVLVKGMPKMLIINESNYVEMLTFLFRDQVQLTNNLGKKGYRYQNIKNIIEQYQLFEETPKTLSASNN